MGASEYTSLESVPSDYLCPSETFCPIIARPPSLVESMRMLDEIISDKTMDRFAKIVKLEANLSEAISNEQVCVAFII